MESFGFAPTITDVEEVDTETFPDVLKEGGYAIFFAATYGEGDPPDAAVSFHEWLNSSDREPDTFEGVQFAVFGLGNKSYDHYNKMGKDIFQRLEELGGKPMYELGLGDDEDNIESDFLIWKKQFKPVLCSLFGLSGEASTIMTFKQKMIKLTETEIKSLPPDVDPTHTSRWQGRDSGWIGTKSSTGRISCRDTEEVCRP